MSLEMKCYKVRIRFLMDALGTAPDKNVYENYLAGKKMEELEKAGHKGLKTSAGEDIDSVSARAAIQRTVDTIDEMDDRGTTSLYYAPCGCPVLKNYQIRGFLSEAARALKEWDEVKQLNSKVKQYVFVLPEDIPFQRNGEIIPKKEGSLERSVRAQTAQGPRISLVKSDLIKAGAEAEFWVHILDGGGMTVEILKDLLGYGWYQGLLQWRTGGWGRFESLSVEEVDEKEALREQAELTAKLRTPVAPAA